LPQAMRAGTTLPNVRSPINLLASVASEESGQGEFAQLVSNHVFRNEYGYMLSSVVHHEGVTDEVREDRGSSGPGFDRLLVATFIHGFHFLH